MHALIRSGLAIGLALLGISPETSRHAPRGVGEDGAPLIYDLAVTSLDVTQTKATPLFREVEVLCIVENLGPNAAPPKTEVTITRPSDDGRKILKRAVIPVWLMREARFQVRTKASVWHASSVPYRCELAVPSDVPAQDSNPANDVKELTFPKM
jgi:hypothetical protein